ncbi:DUF6502 family protein [Marinomonas transparens]|uniref:Uncharacterized protein n=1 Tax=Marinomonas transparens TaxID=2795388 RepID=A0A934JSC7_9GAMM|nr:DUF6502 family protein [Marinomonas transparens]MBJ7536202.1 hypothetical protein [Marinomonas transparens]
MSEHSATSSVKQLIAQALHKVLCPLVKLVVRQGVTFVEFTEILKHAYVEEVQKELTRSGERTTLSRISVVSGVHRKDVKRLTELNPEVNSSRSEKASLTSRLISLWLGDSQYLDEQGKPITLSRSSFELLVRSVSSDIRPRTMLDDCLQKGIIEGNDEGYCLITEALFPSEDLATKIAFFARNTADHIATCEHNVRGEQNAFPERSVFYDHLSHASVIELQKLADEETKALLIRINKRAQSLAKQDDVNENNDHRFILGSYFYQEKDSKND